MHDFYQQYVSSGQAGARGTNLRDHTAPNRPYLEWMIRQTVHGPPQPRILDAACGSGKLVSVLRENGYRDVTGVDLSAEQIALGTELRVEGLVCGDVITHVEDLPNGSIDVIFAIDFLEHLDIETSLRFLHGVRGALRSTGRLVLHVPNGQSPFCAAIRYGDITHTRAFTRTSLQQLLFPARLEIERVMEDRPIIHGVKSLVRRLIWMGGRSALSLLWTAETGAPPDALSRNMLVVARPTGPR